MVADRSVEERTSERICARRMAEQVIEASLVSTPTVVPWRVQSNRLSMLPARSDGRTAGAETLKTLSRVQNQTSALWAPLLRSLLSPSLKTSLEMPVIRTQEELRQVVNQQVQLVVGTDDVDEPASFRRRSTCWPNTLHVLQVVVKTVEEHLGTLAHLASAHV